jgi:hypothetical protein
VTRRLVLTGATLVGALAGALSVVHSGGGGSQPPAPARAVGEGGHRGEHDQRAGLPAKARLPVARLAPAVLERDPDTLVTDPRDPRYDAAALAGLKPSEEIFAHEPRDARWAPAMEKMVTQRMGLDLSRMLPHVQVKQIECHTASCAIEFTMPPELASDFWQAGHALPYAEAVRMDDDGNADGQAHMSMILMFGQQSRQPGDYERWHQAARQRTFAKIQEMVRSGDKLWGPAVYAARLLDEKN